MKYDKMNNVFEKVQRVSIEQNFPGSLAEVSFFNIDIELNITYRVEYNVSKPGFHCQIGQFRDFFVPFEVIIEPDTKLPGMIQAIHFIE